MRKNCTCRNIEKIPIRIFIQVDIHLCVINSKESCKRAIQPKCTMPYYIKTAMYDKNGEPLVELDFEG